MNDGRKELSVKTTILVITVVLTVAGCSRNVQTDKQRYIESGLWNKLKSRKLLFSFETP